MHRHRVIYLFILNWLTITALANAASSNFSGTNEDKVTVSDKAEAKQRDREAMMDILKRNDPEAYRIARFNSENTPKVIKAAALMSANSYDQAIKELLQEATNGNNRAQALLGNAYHHKLNYKLAIKWYKKAADDNNIGAMYGLGKIYEFGQGVSINMRKAFDYYAEAAKRGHRQAADDLCSFPEKYIINTQYEMYCKGYR